MGKTSSMAMLAMKYVDGDVQGTAENVLCIINQNVFFSFLTLLSYLSSLNVASL